MANIRHRSRADALEGDVFPHTAELDSLFGGKLPEDVGERLRFMEGRFRDEAYKPFRHALMFTYRSMGLPIAEIMRRTNRSAATVHRWSVEAKDYFREVFTNLDVRDIHADRMGRQQMLRERLTTKLMSKGPKQQALTPREIAVLVTAMVQVDKLEDRILQHSGYYDVFDIKGVGEDDAEGRASDFRRNLREAFEGDGPMAAIEHQADDLDLQPVASDGTKDHDESG